MKKTAIIGGGITGLATAFYLQEYARGAVDYVLLESASQLGGKITSVRENGFIVEGGPDSFLTQKAVILDLCRVLGLEDQLIGSNRANSATYVWSREHLHPMPEGMMLMAPTMILPFLRSRLISWRGKLRMGMEIWIPENASDEDESLASFVRRRLGEEALEKIAAPLMAGIHAADPEKLSLKSTFPMFLEMEKKHGSILRAMMASKRVQESREPQQKRAPMFMSLRGGLQQLVAALLAQLDPQCVRPNSRVLAVKPYIDQYKITLSDGSCILADDVVFATPTYITADLVQQISPALAFRLRAIHYVSTATVSLGFKRSEIGHALNGSGFIVPREENRKITACSWSSEKFNHRAPDDCVLMRVFVGGARAESLAEQSEAALVRLARQELQAIMGISATPVLAKAYRWHRASPQYEVGHQARIAEIEQVAACHSGLYLAGAAYHGAGIPDCVKSGMKTALEIVTKLAHANNDYKDTVLPVSIPV